MPFGTISVIAATPAVGTWLTGGRTHVEFRPPGPGQPHLRLFAFLRSIFPVAHTGFGC
jgi:hypothetical protein